MTAMKPMLGLGLLALLATSAAWCMLDGAEPAEEARPRTALRPTERLEPRFGRDVVPSLHDRAGARAHDREHDERESPSEEPSAAPPHPTDRVLPLPSPGPRAAPPAPKVLMRVRGVMGLDRAQVSVGSQTVTVGDLREVLVTAGRKPLRWRAHERDAWRPGGSWRFEPGTTVMAFVTAHGLELRTMR
jgi:hypothetical protein